MNNRILTLLYVGNPIPRVPTDRPPNRPPRTSLFGPSPPNARPSPKRVLADVRRLHDERSGRDIAEAESNAVEGFALTSNPPLKEKYILSTYPDLGEVHSSPPLTVVKVSNEGDCVKYANDILSEFQLADVLAVQF